MTVQKLLVTRNEVRQMGLNVSNTTFGRWEEDELLVPFKAGRRRSAIVRYHVDEVLDFITKHTVRRKRPHEKLS